MTHVRNDHKLLGQHKRDVQVHDGSLKRHNGAVLARKFGSCEQLVEQQYGLLAESMKSSLYKMMKLELSECKLELHKQLVELVKNSSLMCMLAAQQ